MRASVSERAGRALLVRRTGIVGLCVVGRESQRLPNICTLHTGKRIPERGAYHTLSLSPETFSVLFHLATFFALSSLCAM